MRAFRFQSTSDSHAALVPATEIELADAQEGEEETVAKEGEAEPTSSELRGTE